MGVVVAEGEVRVTANAGSVANDVARDFSSQGGAAASAGQGLGRSIFGGVIGAYAAIGVTEKVTGWIGDAIMAGSDFNETMSKGSAIFGDQMGAIQKWASTAATSTGLSTQAATAAATSFGDMFSQIGFTGDEAAKMSTKVVQAAADLGSFSNLDTADVSERISAAFRGEYDSLQAVIPNISAARVEQEAMAASGKTNASALTAQEKAAAVLAIVQKDGNRAMGDFAKTSGGFANQMKIAAAQSEDLKGRIGGALQPALQAGAAVVTGTLMPALLGLADRAVPAVSAGVDTISSVLGNMGSIFGPALSVVSSVWSSVWSGLGPALQPFLALLSTIGPQVLQLAASFSPLGLILRALQPVLPVLGQAIGNLATALGAGLSTSLGVITPLMQTLTTTLSGVFAAVLPIVVQLVMTLVSAFASLVPVAGEVLNAVMPIVQSLIGSLMPVLTQLAGAVLPVAASAIGMLVSAIGPLVTTILSVLIPVVNALLPVITTVFNAIVPIVQAAMQIVQGVIQVVTGIITGNWSQVWNGIKNIVGGVWNAIKAVITGAINIVRSIIVAGLNIIRAAWTAIWNGISAAARAVWAGIVSFVSVNINAVRSVVTNVINAIRNVFVSGWNAMRAGVGVAVSGVVGFVRNMASGIGEGVGRAVQFFRELPGKIVAGIGDLAGRLASVGRNVMQGFIDGVSGFAKRMISAVTAPIQGAIDGAKNLLGIHSPSRVFRQIGDYVGKGLEQGLKGSTSGVRSAMRSMSNAVVSEFNKEERIRAQARKTIATLQAGNNPLRKTAAGRSEIARRIAAANRQIADQPLTSGKTNGVLRRIDQMDSQLERYAGRRDAIADRLKAANKKLTAAQKQYDDYRKSVVQSLSSYDITDATTSGGIVAGLQEQLKDTKAFTLVMQQLRKAGLDSTSYRQFIAAGTDSLTLAQDLLKSGQIKTVANLQNQLGRSTSAFATSAAAGLYGAGVNAAKGLVNGLNSQQKELQKSMERIAKTMVGTVKRALGIRSPSRVMRDEVGVMMSRGLIDGFTGQSGAMGRAVRGTIAGVTASAGIAAPSIAASVAGSGTASFAAQQSQLTQPRPIVVNEARDPLGTAGRIRKELDMYGRM